MDPSELPLRDIHLPPAIEWWPPAPGWWLLAGITMASLVAAYLWYRRRNAPLGIDRAAAAELAAIRDDFARGGDSQCLLRQLSVLMRRICITRFPRSTAAACHGEAWLRLLDELAGKPAFSRGAGRVLATGPYQREAEFEPEALLAVCGELVQGLDSQPSVAA